MEADRAQLGLQMLPLPGALCIAGRLAVVKADGFRGVVRRVRGVVDHVSDSDRLTG